MCWLCDKNTPQDRMARETIIAYNEIRAALPICRSYVPITLRDELRKLAHEDWCNADMGAPCACSIDDIRY